MVPECAGRLPRSAACVVSGAQDQRARVCRAVLAGPLVHDVQWLDPRILEPLRRQYHYSPRLRQGGVLGGGLAGDRGRAHQDVGGGPGHGAQHSWGGTVLLVGADALIRGDQDGAYDARDAIAAGQDTADRRCSRKSNGHVESIVCYRQSRAARMLSWLAEYAPLM